MLLLPLRRRSGNLLRLLFQPLRRASELVLAPGGILFRQLNAMRGAARKRTFGGMGRRMAGICVRAMIDVAATLVTP